MGATMSDDERLARLTELARRVWPHARIEWDGDALCVLGPVQQANGRTVVAEHLRINPHPRAADALEAALLVLASGETWHGRMGELDECLRVLRAQYGIDPPHVLPPPAWVEQLAAEFRRRSATKDEDGKGCAAWAYLEAAELLEARAKGGER